MSANNKFLNNQVWTRSFLLLLITGAQFLPRWAGSTFHMDSFTGTLGAGVVGMRHAGSWLSSQGLKPCSLHQKPRVLTTEHQGSPYKLISYQFSGPYAMRTCSWPDFCFQTSLIWVVPTGEVKNLSSSPTDHLHPHPPPGARKWKVKVKAAQSCPTLCDSWTIRSVEFSRPEYWSGLRSYPSQNSALCLPLKTREMISWPQNARWTAWDTVASFCREFLFLCRNTGAPALDRRREDAHAPRPHCLTEVLGAAGRSRGAKADLRKGVLCAHVSSHFSRVRLFVTLWTVAHQAPLSIGFPSQEHWGGSPCPPPGESSQLRGQTHVSHFFCWQTWSLPPAPPGKPHCGLVAKSGRTLCNPTDCGLPGPSVHGISQARKLEWTAISSRGSSRPRDWTCVSCEYCIGRQVLYHWATREAHN